ncbi:host attachment protein [Bdellovibrio reynosensis]|uniref:Host attachment protein n=1 Tax=Bdellovibrio reynosensis TaxID=2835041 RepID=A0ABY4CBN5_9BACT|nr:host attachment protein [Bdellovibrio reynosensis]UOF02376.1 host attachment protein [Bdellovibrio reynosensis]
MKTWIVVVNRTQAKVFACTNKRGDGIEFVTKLDNPRGRLRAQDINADKWGVFATLMSHGSRQEKKEGPTDRVAQEFAIKVSDFLDECLLQKNFDDLILIAEPQFLGRLRNLLGREVKALISQEIAKDLNLVSVDDLRSRLYPEVPSMPAERPQQPFP